MFYGEKINNLKSFGNPGSEAPPSQLCPSQVENLCILGYFWFHVLSYFWHVIVLFRIKPRDAKQKKLLSTCTKMLSLQKTQQADRYSFYSPTKFFHMCLICIPPCPLCHSQGQGDSSWHRGRGAPLTRATAQINWGTPPPWKKQEENDGSLLYHGPPATGGRELGGLGECPHATAQVLKYKARGVRRTIPQKYSTNLSMEAKGEWARPLPSEGVG